ncbi:MAG: bifunctional DNA primase/polymerase [Magnetococcales bacterium]|nr:bifunctional DNA primase/polymerase [Magnetococcales bacterium]
MNPYGATPQDWENLTQAAGCENLLPTVCNPNAVISETSKLQKPGKVPCIYNRYGKVAGLVGWPTKETTFEEVVAWRQQSDYGICIQGRAVQAIDVDVVDEALATEIRDYIPSHLHVRKRANSSKFLVAFILPANEWNYRRIKTEHGNIEFLAAGKQFVAAGTHESGTRYEWECGTPSAFHGLSVEEFECLWTALETAFATEPRVTSGTTNSQVPTDAPGADDDVAVYLHNKGLVLEETEGKLHIDCPWKNNHSSDTGVAQTSYLLPGSRGHGSGYFKCFHAGCQDKQQSDFLYAVGFINDAFSDAPLAPEGMQDCLPLKKSPLDSLTRNRDGYPNPNLANVDIILTHHELFQGVFAFDMFKNDICLTRTPPWEVERTGDKSPRELTDNDVLGLTALLQSQRMGTYSMLRIDDNTVGKAVVLVANRNPVHPVRDYLSGLTWDGEERLLGWATKYLGAESTDYVGQAGRSFLISAVARVFRPGCKADCVLTLVGPQGGGKSTALSILGGEWFRDTAFDMSNKDAFVQLRGVWIYELAELSALARAEVEKIKAFISSTKDVFRPPYGRSLVNCERQMVFCASTNNPEFLKDTTGNRRFWPVTVGKIDLDGLREVKDQLWAEAVAAYNGGEHWWLSAEAESVAREVQEEHTQSDFVADYLANIVDTKDEWTNLELATMIQPDISRVPNNLSHRVGSTMKRLGWKKKQKRINGIQTYYYIKPSVGSVTGVTPT